MILLPIFLLIGLVAAIMWSDTCVIAIFELHAGLHRNDPVGEVEVIEIYNPHGH